MNRLPLPGDGEPEVAVAAPGAGVGAWAGASSAALDGEGGFVIAYRIRHTHADRGSTIVARSADGVHLTTVATLDKSRFHAASMERPAIVRTDDGRWRLYVCSASMPPSKHWWIDLLAGIGTQWTGWAPAEALEVTGAPDETTTIITLDGRGSGDADSANVEANTALVARVMATPMDGRETCDIEVTVAGVDGAHVTVNDVAELDAPTEFIASGLDDESLRQAEAGQVSMQVASDCTFAASLDALPL